MWCVFDKYDFPHHNFDNAIAKAKSHGIHVAYSNEAFELWLLLHYEYRNQPCGREELNQKLSEYTHFRYEKSSLVIKKVIKLLDPEKESMALLHANKLYIEYIRSGATPSKGNPITTVFKLVELLRKWQ